ncbi:MAG TPA: cytosine permease [Steroidobacteraceae bacterium]|nr:cytosine permease [Steroidobacteraceae bacterium]
MRINKLVEAGASSRPTSLDLRSWLFFASVQTGVTICIPVFALGTELGRHAALATLVPGILLGGLIVAILASLTGYAGYRQRGPTAMIVRGTFGSTGGKLVTVLLIVSSFGWFSVQLEMLVKNFNEFLAVLAVAPVSRIGATLLAGAVMSTTAIVGYRALGRVAYVAVPLLLIVVGVPLWTGLQGRDLTELTLRPADGPAYSFGLIVSIVSGTYITGTTLCPDLTRFLRTRKDVVAGAFFSLACAYPLLLSLSAALGVVYGSNSIIEVMHRAGFMVPALVVLSLATWTSNDKNVYEAALALSVLVPGVARWKLTTIAAALGILWAMVGVYDHFVVALLFLGICVAPLAGVYVTDFLLDERRYQDPDPPPAFRWRPFVAWGAGIAIGSTTLSAAAGGLGLWTLTNVPTLDALLGAALTQLMLTRWEAAGAVSRRDATS